MECCRTLLWNVSMVEPTQVSVSTEPTATETVVSVASDVYAPATFLVGQGAGWSDVAAQERPVRFFGADVDT